VEALTFEEARAAVLRLVGEAAAAPSVERVALEAASGRVLAEDVAADRDVPATARSIRDGYAVRSSDVPGALEVIGEVRAGDSFEGRVGRGQAVEIMTGAPVPAGADAVVMVEDTRREGTRVTAGVGAAPGQFINPRASEAAAGEVVIHPGRRLDYRDVAALAAFGHASVSVYRRPVVAIVPTGDEIVEVSELPREFQIRNSNAYSLAAQVERAGGTARVCGVARDQIAHTRETIERALDADLLLLSGGVSAGKYDVVEVALAALGAEIVFDRVLIQPGRPLVFGRVRGKFFFGLPGNPASTMVTFELFARAALELLAGEREPALEMPLARLTQDFRHKTGLTRFLPARLGADGAEVTPLPWSGSSDVPAMARSNVYLVAEAGRAEWRAGDLIRVLLR
jgi:molybdopterin molybdotransferase